jgi:hypothetical protein
MIDPVLPQPLPADHPPDPSTSTRTLSHPSDGRPRNARKPTNIFMNETSILGDPVTIDRVSDEKAEIGKREFLLKVVVIQVYVIAILSGVLLLGIPVFQPVYQYYARNPQNQVMALVPLYLPNMTNRAVLSWATVSVTEILTMGFGDFESHLKSQKFRFTPDGWDSFSKAFDTAKIGETFRNSQLVLTTVPSDTPVIVLQGVNDTNVYQWEVQMPVIMTYATNNNTTHRQRVIVDMIIVRAPTDQVSEGIAIKNWTLSSK